MVSLLFTLLLLTTEGCTISSSRPVHDLEAQRHISLARSLEEASALEEATLKYRFVAENYSSTRYFQEAVHKTALLYSMPSNPAADEGAALHWLQTYLTLPMAQEEKPHIQVHIALLQRILSLKHSLGRDSYRIEELSALAKEQQTGLSARSRRIQELEARLRRATQELEELKRVDVWTSRSSMKKQRDSR